MTIIEAGTERFGDNEEIILYDTDAKVFYPKNNTDMFCTSYNQVRDYLENKNLIDSKNLEWEFIKVSVYRYDYDSSCVLYEACYLGIHKPDSLHSNAIFSNTNKIEYVYTTPQFKFSGFPHYSGYYAIFEWSEEHDRIGMMLSQCNSALKYISVDNADKLNKVINCVKEIHPIFKKYDLL